jgi:hypothetical protein
MHDGTSYVLANLGYIRQSPENVQTLDRHFEEKDGQKVYEGLIPHDLRRYYTRTINESGIPASVGSQLTGHLDMAMFDRYSGPQREEPRYARETRIAHLRKKAVAA